MKTGYTLIELLVTITITISFALLILAGVFLVRGCNAVTDKGLKHAVQEVWEGKK